MKRMIVILLGLVIATTVGAQELTIATLEGTSHYGPLVIQVLKQAGITAKLVTYPTPEALYPALARGQVDAAFFLAQPIISQLNGAVMIPVRLHQTNFCAVTLDQNIKVANPGDLRKYTVGVVKDQMAHTMLTRGMKTVTAPTDVAQFKMLAAGDFQVAISVDMATPFYAGAAGIKTFYIQQPPLLMSPTFLALAKKQAALESKITPVFRTWLESGQWKKAIDEADAKVLKK